MNATPATPPPRAPRVSLTKAQLATEAGIELQALLLGLIGDGALSPPEIEQLSLWLKDNSETELPGAEYLRATVARILSDGKVTSDELHELHLAVEKVLPPDLRRTAKAKRVNIAAAAAGARAESSATVKDPTRPIQTFDFMVAGVHYEGRGRVIEESLYQGDQVLLVREPNNRYSRNATLITLLSGEAIGYVPEVDAKEVAPLLDAEKPYQAYVKKILSGRRAPIPVVVLKIYETGTNPTELPPGLSTARRQTGPSRAMSFLANVLIALFLLLLLLFVSRIG